MAVTAVGTPDPEPSKADLLAAMQRMHAQFMAGFAEIHQRLDAMPDVSPRASRSDVEPLPGPLEGQSPMQGFLIDESE